MKPIIHLCIPQLFQPLKSWKNDFKVEINLPIIESLLSRFEIVEDGKSNCLEQSMFNALGYPENQEIPLAFYRYQANIDHSIASSTSKQYVCADPIHLEAGMNDVTLTDVITDLTQSETEEILEDLNKHFSQDGIEFIQDSKQRCYLVLPEKEELQTTPISIAFRSNVAKFQPHSNVRNWRVIQNESQMILHNCDVNHHREIAGLPTINSFWFWGGGKPSEQNYHSLEDVFYSAEANNFQSSAKENARILAKAAKCDYINLPDELPSFSQGKSLVILEQLVQAAINENIDLYQQQLSYLESVILPFKNLWELGEVELLIDSCDGKVIKPLKPKAWKFWEKSQFPALLQ